MRIATFGIIALAAFHVTTGRSAAQFIGPYSGYGYGGFGGYGYGGFGGYGFGGYGPRYGGYYGYPGAFGSFWTNGRSLYGPPVATGAPIPGSFGGSDASYNTSSPGSYSPYFWNGSRGVSGASREFAPIVAPADYNGPRFATRDVKRRYAQDRANPQAAIDRAYRDAGRPNPR